MNLKPEMYQFFLNFLIFTILELKGSFLFSHDYIEKSLPKRSLFTIIDDKEKGCIHRNEKME